MSHQLDKKTLAIRTQTPRSNELEHSTPLYLTSSFVFDNSEDMAGAFADENDNNIYSRYSNPNVQEFVDKICLLEGAEAGFATSSGMAAIFASFFSFLQSGDHLISCNAVFGGTHTILKKYFPRFKIDVTFVDAQKPDEWEKAIQSNTKMLYVETPTNPGLDIVDLEKIGKLCKKHNILFNVDNCFATPIGQTPIDFGADLVVHSATKWMDGQGRVLGGIVVGKKELINEVYLFCRNAGPSMSPFNAWVLSKSIETLDVRMERHANNALFLATQLQHHPKIKWLKYPFLPSHPNYEVAIKQMKNGGGLFCFELSGGIDAGRKFMNKLRLLSLTPNLGDTRSIASHPASTTHCKLSQEEQLAVGITPGFIRVSVGLEHQQDILNDILQALA